MLRESINKSDMYILLHVSCNKYNLGNYKYIECILFILIL